MFDIIKKTHELCVKFLLSNANVELVKKSFETFEREELTAKRAINSKNPESVTKELLIYNWIFPVTKSLKQIYSISNDFANSKNFCWRILVVLNILVVQLDSSYSW